VAPDLCSLTSPNTSRFMSGNNQSSINWENPDTPCLERLRKMGFSPDCIYDVGASDGWWTRNSAAIFSGCSFQMFEPLSEISGYKAQMQATLSSPIDCRLHSLALGSVPGIQEIFVDENRVGSSFLPDMKSEYFPQSISVEVCRLDDFILTKSLPQPQLIKIDTQGYEMEILKGAVNTLKNVDVLLVEAWLIRGYGPSTPLLFEMAHWLSHHQFFLADFSGSYRDESGLLFSQDCIFVRQSSKIAGMDRDRSFVIK
jgi:FkbM family methyltransferase